MVRRARPYLPLPEGATDGRASRPEKVYPFIMYSDKQSAQMISVDFCLTFAEGVSKLPGLEGVLPASKGGGPDAPVPVLGKTGGVLCTENSSFWLGCFSFSV
jgi:hypothetical protein